MTSRIRRRHSNELWSIPKNDHDLTDIAGERDHLYDPNQKSKTKNWKGELAFIIMISAVSFLVGRRTMIHDERSVLLPHDDAAVRSAVTPSTITSKATPLELHQVGEKGGAWTAETHLRKYGFNVDAGLVDVIEESCREIENQRQPDGSEWSQHPGDGPIHGLWRPPKVVDCRVLELGPGVGVYVDSLKKDQAKKNRKVYGIEPNPMGGTFERRNGPHQLAINILETDDPYKLAKKICQDELDGESFDLVYSIEVCEHMPPDRHEDAARFLAGLSRKGTKLIFGAAGKGQTGTGHIGNRPKNEWEGKFNNRKQCISVIVCVCGLELTMVLLL